MPRFPYYLFRLRHRLRDLLGLARPRRVNIVPHARARLVCFGDSITEHGGGPEGYVGLLAADLSDAGVEVINAGVSGDRVGDLLRRLDRDVKPCLPAVVLVYIGINDVWGWRDGSGTRPPDYARDLRLLVERLHAAGATVLLATPTVIGEAPPGENPFDDLLAATAEAVRSLAQVCQLPVVDLYTAFRARLAAQPTAGLTTDGVHLSPAGYRLVYDVAAPIVQAALKDVQL